MSDSESPKKETGSNSPLDPHSPDWQSALAPEIAKPSTPAANVGAGPEQAPFIQLPASSLPPPPVASPEPSPWKEFSSDPVTPEKMASEEIEAEEMPVKSCNKIGLLGGSQVGKTYLFHGMVYRTRDERRAGSVSYYLQSADLRLLEKPGAPQRRLKIYDIIKGYQNWKPLLPTHFGAQIWYRLTLEFRTGLFGQNPTPLQLDFLDGSGEGFTRPLGPLTTPIWKDAFYDAGIMVFCLPMWAAFPADNLSEEDQRLRDAYLSEFFLVLENYREIRDRKLKVRTILALTMADDDRRCYLQDVIDQWIKPYMEDPEKYLASLHKGRGLTSYLAGAELVSSRLREEFRAIKGDPQISSIPRQLDFGLGYPWIIPMSAVEGRILERAIEARKGKADDAPLSVRLPPPVPVHVELPLLAALCENHNALM